MPIMQIMMPSTEDVASRDRDLRAMQLVAVSGFAQGVCESMQSTCLALCNAWREGVPLKDLQIRPGVPPTMLATLRPSILRHRSVSPSRVEPHRQFLRLHISLESRQIQGSKAAGDLVPEDIHENAVWPLGTRNIVVSGFDKPIDVMQWPSSLQRVAFGAYRFSADDAIKCIYYNLDVFNQRLDRVLWPAGLREVFLGGAFDQPIRNVAWPPALERLSMPAFNQSLNGMRWPARLKTLEFALPTATQDREDVVGYYQVHGGRFNQQLGAELPASLETLRLSEAFSQSVLDVEWPAGLVEVLFGRGFRGLSLSGVEWPSSLRSLAVAEDVPGGFGNLPSECRVAVISRELHGDPIASTMDIDDYAEWYYDRDSTERLWYEGGYYMDDEDEAM